MAFNDYVSRETPCTKCGEAFLKINGCKVRGHWYCGYCAAVLFGEPDNGWLPKLNGEKLPGGYHKE